MYLRAPRVLAALAAGAMLLAACGSSSKSVQSSNTTTSAAAAAGSTSSAAPAAASTAASYTASLQTTGLGKTLVDSKGMTLYAFKVDKPGVSNCNAGCDGTWPPLHPSGAIKLGPGLDSEDFKIIERPRAWVHKLTKKA